MPICSRCSCRVIHVHARGSAMDDRRRSHKHASMSRYRRVCNQRSRRHVAAATTCRSCCINGESRQRCWGLRLGTRSHTYRRAGTPPSARTTSDLTSRRLRRGRQCAARAVCLMEQRCQSRRQVAASGSAGRGHSYCGRKTHFLCWACTEGGCALGTKKEVRQREEQRN